jgi:hypothetical protein
MLVWATEFPLVDGVGCDDVLSVAKGWLVTSPHSRWTIDSFADEALNDITRHELDGHVVNVGRIDEAASRWAGLQHQWTERGEREWTTEVVARQSQEGILVSVRLERTLLRAGPNPPAPKKPYVVKRLLEDLGGGRDGKFVVSDTPHRLEEADVASATAIVKGVFDQRLPIVYVSAGRFGKPFVDPDELARWLSGMAHVVVEPSRYFSFALARNVNSKNVYGGAVGVYWPQGSAPPDRFLPSALGSPDEMQRRVSERVQAALTQIRPVSQCTFGFLRELVSKAKVEQLRAAGSTELASYVSAFDDEINGKEQRLSELTREVQRLRAELRRYEDARNDGDAGILARGEEQELYPGELKDAVLHTLELGRNNLLEDGRRRHLIDDLRCSNSPTDTEEEMTEVVKTALAGGGDIAHGRRAALEELGFVIEEGGKHIKAKFRDDDRYSFTISKTSSDHRAGKNLSSAILQKLFK